MENKNFKPTPGPWVQHIKRIEGEKEEEGYRTIKAVRKAHYDEETNTGFKITDYVSESDAQLMASAPDLLEALIELSSIAMLAHENMLKTNPLGIGFLGSIERAEKVIKKATGL